MPNPGLKMHNYSTFCTECCRRGNKRERKGDGLKITAAAKGGGNPDGAKGRIKSLSVRFARAQMLRRV